MMKLLFLACLFCFSSDAKPKKDKYLIDKGPSYVTYAFSGGRFGDNLVAYIHAKWISYKYDLPLLYQPFSYSDGLVLDQDPPPHVPSNRRLFRDNPSKIQPNGDFLYIVPYFPDFAIEHKYAKTSPL